jgi:hypothetical protein
MQQHLHAFFAIGRGGVILYIIIMVFIKKKCSQIKIYKPKWKLIQLSVRESYF